MEKVYKMKTSEVEKFCKRQKEKFKATKCEGKDIGGGFSDVTVVLPDSNIFSATATKP